ncbi:response regulator [Geotalea toluenoxydans]|uniref:response regulator n=1 Tax=Geotalea toluenoxydans TaxID=421624 RepID=UPI000A457AF2|nr:response regulator [Geotalea toluenoxydans]
MAKVLLVDDVNMFLEIQKGFLQRSSVTILTARDGAEALAITRAKRPDVVFMDLHMPNMGGAECCTAIKADAALRSTTVVLITSVGKPDDEILCRKAGCDSFLTKPLDRNDYLELARTYLPQIDRREDRLRCSTKVRFTIFSASLSGEIHDISNHGAYIATDYNMEANAIVSIIFALPGDGAIIQPRAEWPGSTHPAPARKRACPKASVSNSSISPRRQRQP